MLGLIKSLSALSNLCGVSGDEGAVRRYIKERVTPLADEVFTDTMGNLYAHKRPHAEAADPAPVVAICAHMDEVGMLIYKILDNGELKYDYAGLDPRIMPGRRVYVGHDRVCGVIDRRGIRAQL